MVTIETKFSVLKKLLAKNAKKGKEEKAADLSIKELEEALFNYGMELDAVSGDDLSIDVTPDRPDMVSPQGLARALRGYLNIEKGLCEYKIEKSGVEIKVDESVSAVRPYTVAAVIRNLKLDSDKIKELIWVQEKLHDTFARGRKKAAIGVYPLEKITPPITYCAMDPKKIRFVPLDFDEELTGEEVLSRHPTGMKFAHLLKEHKAYPFFIDAKKQVLSMPPIINSQHLGKVTESTKDVFIECSGSDLKALNLVLNILVTMFSDMGGKICSVKIRYLDKELVTPDLKPEERKIKAGFVNARIGLDLKPKEVAGLLERMRYGVKSVRGDEVSILVPAYRTDILHDVDVADDVARAYGFGNIKPELPEIPTAGATTPLTDLFDEARMAMIGLGFQEVFTLALTSAEEQYARMRMPEQPHVSLGYSEEKSINMVRSWLLPEVIKCVVSNRQREFPQKVFEADFAVEPDSKADVRSRNVPKLACLIADEKAEFSEIKSVLSSLMGMLGAGFSVKEKNVPCFIPGRSAEILIDGKSAGIIGELHPAVLEKWGLEMPVAAFELDLSPMLEKRAGK